jgi:hypothetical protein
MIGQTFMLHGQACLHINSLNRYSAWRQVLLYPLFIDKETEAQGSYNYQVAKLRSEQRCEALVVSYYSATLFLIYMSGSDSITHHLASFSRVLECQVTT